MDDLHELHQETKRLNRMKNVVEFEVDMRTLSNALIANNQKRLAYEKGRLYSIQPLITYNQV